MEFYVNVMYEKPPQFCLYCGTIGHSMGFCRRRSDSMVNQAPRTNNVSARNNNKERILTTTPVDARVEENST